jgi:DNA-binding transcriptional ArsR family regulator
VGAKKQQRASSISQKMAWAYAHPVRARALMLLSARIASPRQIAEELDEPLGKVSYHVRALRDAGLIELIEADGSRGGVQHFYRANQLAIVDTEEARAQDASERATSSAVVINLMVSDIATAVEEGTLDSRPERVLVRHRAQVDKKGWDELSELHTNALYRSIAIHRESMDRLRESGEPAINVSIHSLVFEMAEPGDQALPGTIDATLEWADGGDTSFSAGGGSKGRRPDDGDAP